MIASYKLSKTRDIRQPEACVQNVHIDCNKVYENTLQSCVSVKSSYIYGCNIWAEVTKTIFRTTRIILDLQCNSIEYVSLCGFLIALIMYKRFKINFLEDLSRFIMFNV